MWSKRRLEQSIKEWGSLTKLFPREEKSFFHLRFYSYNCKCPYEHLSEANLMIEKLEVEVRWWNIIDLVTTSLGEGAPIASRPLWGDCPWVRAHRPVSSWEQDAQTDVGLYIPRPVRDEDAADNYLLAQNANINNGYLLFMMFMLIKRLIPSGHRLRSGRRQCGPTLTWRTWTWSARSLPRWPSSPLFVVAHPTQDVRGFDKTMRPWHAYQGLVIFIKNLSILGPMPP